MDTRYSDEDIERCTLRNRKEIFFQLRNLIKRGERVSVIFQEGKQSFLTVLIDVSEENSLLYFDIGGSHETNQLFLKSERSTFSSIVDGIQIQFAAGKCRETNLRGEPVFAVAVPQAMLRLQRREYYRLQLPTTKPVICRVRRGTPEETALPLHDISVGGIGVLSPQPLNFDRMETLEKSSIDLQDNGVIHVTLEVRYLTPLESRSGKPLWHLGCRFVDLSPAVETTVQRFMARIEAERRTLSAS